MIEYLEANTINILECRQDGYLLLDNQTYTWIPEISPTIKMLYNINNGENNIQDIYFKREPTGLSMTIYNYFPENSMEICLVYSCEDLTNNNEMYSKIEGKWFLCTLGLT